MDQPVLCTSQYGAYRDRQYPYEPGNWPPEFNLVGNDEQGVRRALGVS